MTNYSKYKINEDILKLAFEISQEIPHYFLKDIIHKAKQRLKECNRLIEVGQETEVLYENLGTLNQCLIILGGESSRSPHKLHLHKS